MTHLMMRSQWNLLRYCKQFSVGTLVLSHKIDKVAAEIGTKANKE